MEKHKFNGSSDVFRELIGKTIYAFHLNENRDELFFMTGTNEWMKYDAYGDCCSQSWFEHVDSPSNGAMNVLEVLERDMPEGRSDPEHDCLRFYGWSLVTTCGYFDIEMRNSSNGYYGGDVLFSGNESPDSVRKHLKEKAEAEAKKKEADKDIVSRSIFKKMVDISKYIDFKVMVGVCSSGTMKKLKEEVETCSRFMGVSNCNEKLNFLEFISEFGKVIVLEDKSAYGDEIGYMIPLNKVSHLFSRRESK